MIYVQNKLNWYLVSEQIVASTTAAYFSREYGKAAGIAGALLSSIVEVSLVSLYNNGKNINGIAPLLGVRFFSVLTSVSLIIALYQTHKPIDYSHIEDAVSATLSSSAVIIALRIYYFYGQTRFFPDYLIR